MHRSLADKTLHRFMVHIIPDDKFINMAYREFEEVAPGLNKLILLGEERPLRYVEKKNVNFCSAEQACATIQSNECAAVIFHSLGDISLLKDIPSGKKVFWLGWGFDYYNRLLSNVFSSGLFLSETRKLLNDVPKRSLVRRLASKCKLIIKLAIGQKTPQYPINLLARVDYFSPVLEIEYHLACKLNSWFKPEYISWNYGTVEDDWGITDEVEGKLGNNILVGNSATPENNHLEVFEMLERSVDLTGRIIFVPLSYGDTWYKEKIIMIGKEKFGDKFVPLTNFMVKDKYMELLQSCGYVFMNHVRQQGLGNVCIMMLKGAKLYMNKQSPIYRWLGEKGAIIQSVDSIAHEPNNDKYRLRPLSAKQRAINIDVIKGHWGRDVQRAKSEQLVALAMS